MLLFFPKGANEMNEKVIIIGGGVAGLAMSLFLKKANIESVVYEQAKAFGKVGGHFVMHPSGIAMMELLGLGEELMNNSHALTDFAVLDKDNNSVFGEMEQELEGELADMPVFVNITRYNLIDVLYKEVQKQGIDVQFDKRLKQFMQDTEQVVVEFEDGSEAIGTILIGADGVRSKTRQQLFPEKELHYLGKTGVYAIVENEKLGELQEYFSQDAALMYFHDNFNFFVAKHHPTEEAISWSIITTEPEQPSVAAFDEKPIKQIRKELSERFAGWEMPIQQLVESTDHLIAKSLFRIDLMQQYSVGRAILIGDALHTADPNAGMGTTLGLEDAMVLAKLLRDNDYVRAFAQFQEARKDRAEKVYHSANLLESLELENADDYALFDEGIDVSWEK